MWKYCAIYNVLCIIIIVVHGHDFKNFDDAVHFKINWPGETTSELLESQTNVEPYFITTANKERYQCLIVHNTDQEQDSNEPYKGPNPIEILSPLLNQNSCSYRVESYWTYELCHGRYVCQYHQDRDGKKVKTQEYYLGTFDTVQILKLLAEYTERESSPTKKAEIPVKKIDGVNMPYVEFEMGDGTVCDLTNKPRKIKVLYICNQHGKHELFSLEEPSSCEYEAVVLSPWLCSHPDYKPQTSGENEINCHPIDNAPKRPKSLIAMEMESMKLRYQKVMDSIQNGEAHVRVEIHPVGVIDKHNSIEDTINSLTDQGVSPAEVSPVKNFLGAKHCLHGGNGWWKYAFCYGKSVVQYHIERDGRKTIVILGVFNKEKHLEWIAAHPQKSPKLTKLRKQLSHFYSDGSVCEKTGKQRQTEVKLKCVENHTASPSSISLFLLEPKTCEYILGVESPFICNILEHTDENGLLNEKFQVNFHELKITVARAYVDLDERIANGDD